MKRLLLLLATVLCCATWMVAQSDSGQNSSGNQAGSSEQTSSHSGQANSGAGNGDVRVTGCLREANGQFQVTDIETGTSYSLMGRRDLSKYVGSDVDVMGMPTGTSGSTASSGSDNQNLGKGASENPFQVHSIKQRGECRNKQQ